MAAATWVCGLRFGFSRGVCESPSTTRSDEKAARFQSLGLSPVIADVLKPDTLKNLPGANRVLQAVGLDRSAGVTHQQVYVDGLRNVLQALEGRVGGLVLASSTGVYGQNDGSWVDEDSPTEPISESGRALLEAETLASAFTGTEVNSVVIRFAGLYGPGRIIGRSTLEKGLPFPGDPEHYVNLIHIDDAAEAATRALVGEVGWPILLAADDRPTRRGDCYRLAARLLGTPEPRFEPGERRSGRGDSNKRVLNGRLRAVLGDDLAFPSIDEGLPAALSEERSS